MLVLGIETTCDETAAAVVERQPDGRGRILSNVVLSQIDQHAAFGGVVPEIVARAHVEVLDGIVAEAMTRAGVPLERELKLSCQLRRDDEPVPNLLQRGTDKHMPNDRIHESVVVNEAQLTGSEIVLAEIAGDERVWNAGAGGDATIAGP